jgi:sigma-B regulation protein RsbQ
LCNFVLFKKFFNMHAILASSVFSRNNVKVFGFGSQVLMLAHGFGCDQNTWRLITPAFEKHFKIVLFDYVGAGNSDHSAYDEERYNSLEGYAQDIIEICEELQLNEVIFIGHSVSSMIGLLAAKKAPQLFKKIAFIGPSPRYMNDEGYPGGLDRDALEELLDVMDNNYLSWSSIIAPSIMGNPDRPELAEGLSDSFCRTNPLIARQFARVTFLSDHREELPKLSIPSLTIQCREDFLTNDDIAEYIHQHTPGNKITFLSSSGHCPHLSDPEGVVNALKPFLTN